MKEIVVDWDERSRLFVNIDEISLVTRREHSHPMSTGSILKNPYRLINDIC